ncbi:TPA: hypothetical protein ACOQ31_005614 [Bacillus cereus]|uniref:hypothetical protein n=1 Tax=Bacillus cereus group TaxID=86661 RepID=UPI001928B76A|nr:hypothetical protein [Bacillus cereus]MBL3768496.1 hypothetical protein [Bacillus cereus]MBL3774479.1 hypothetical protein [Bacillus cereus]MBL3780303.1 hypothetical protein [Bacillus cereus]MBL3791480.1 hypothetical protein [Bacillus cereus]MBL3881089.1 hypothetical protein [Bacillus cereus]
MDSKTYQSGQVTIVIHSNLVNMESNERRQWFQRELDNENPILIRLNDVINQINKELSLNA